MPGTSSARDAQGADAPKLSAVNRTRRSAGWTRRPARGPSSAPTPTARSSRARTPRATRSRRASCRPSCARTWSRCTRSRAAPTTSPTSPNTRGAAPRRSTAGKRSCGRCFHGEADHPVFVALADTIEKRDLPDPAARGHAGRVPHGPGREALRDHRGAARLHRALRRAGRAPAAGAVRLPRSGAGALRRRAVDRAAADQLLAGRRRSTPPAIASTSPPRISTSSASPRPTSRRSSPRRRCAI